MFATTCRTSSKIRGKIKTTRKQAKRKTKRIRLHAKKLRCANNKAHQNY